MAFESKVVPGKKFGNGFKQKKFDEMHGKGGAMESPEHEAKESPEFERGEQEGAKEGGEQPQEVVAQHGAAVSTHVHHDHKANKHKIVSHHPDGHMHESEHPSAQEAHDTGKQLAGAGEGPEEQENPMTGGEQQPDGFAMPSL